MEQVSLEDRQVFDRAAARLVLAWSRSGLTISEVSELSGIGRSTIYRYLTGQRFVSAYSLMHLCPILHVSSDWILGIEREAPGAPPPGSPLTSGVAHG